MQCAARLTSTKSFPYHILGLPHILPYTCHLQISPLDSLLLANLQLSRRHLPLVIMIKNNLSLPPLQHLLALLCLLLALSPSLTAALPVPTDKNAISTERNLKARGDSTAEGEDVVWPPFTAPVTGISFMQGPANEDGSSGPPGIVVS